MLPGPIPSFSMVYNLVHMLGGSGDEVRKATCTCKYEDSTIIMNHRVFKELRKCTFIKEGVGIDQTASQPASQPKPLISVTVSDARVWNAVNIKLDF